MNIDSIIFDLDGTLWDSTDGVLKSWNTIIENNKDINVKLTKEILKGTMGLQIIDIGRKLFPNLSDDRIKELMKDCCELENEYLEKHGGILYDNLEETLKELSSNSKLFIVSNCQCGYIEVFLKYHNLGKYFLDFENPGRTGLSKGENIKLVVERNKLKSSVYVGDTEGDLKAAKFAGIPFIYASYGFGEVSEYDYSIKRFNELLELVKQE
ncbi:HAD family hydrolase [Clostridium swellfunianum]|uniref:HAD family hydrolase n=1 Tax=Clostridium swellfunianum TaxID=1367462 RepID=UPI00202E6ED2|nr:HAD family hydrolase [Clostridium swellfunianum]MCM0648526.1 HAD family hydrolase [Clostridium swellfunianum]